MLSARYIFDCDSKVVQATATALHKMSEYGLLHIFEKGVYRDRKCIACEGRYFDKVNMPKLIQNSANCLVTFRHPRCNINVGRINKVNKLKICAIACHLLWNMVPLLNKFLP